MKQYIQNNKRRRRILINELRKHDKRSQLELVREFVDLTGLDDTKMMINSKTGTVSITGRKNGYQYTTTMQQEKHGQIVKNSSFEINVGKDALIEQIKELRRQGYKQLEIADMLGISQSLVSKYSRM